MLTGIHTRTLILMFTPTLIHTFTTTLMLTFIITSMCRNRRCPRIHIHIRTRPEMDIRTRTTTLGAHIRTPTFRVRVRSLIVNFWPSESPGEWCLARRLW